MTSQANTQSLKSKAIDILKQGIDKANHYIDSLPHSNAMFDDRQYSSNSGNYRPSSVLIVLRFNDTSDRLDDCWDVLLTLRPNHMRFHKGLVCLPGGKLEKGEDAVACALREANVSIS